MQDIFYGVTFPWQCRRVEAKVSHTSRLCIISNILCTSFTSFLFHFIPWFLWLFVYFLSTSIFFLFSSFFFFLRSFLLLFYALSPPFSSFTFSSFFSILPHTTFPSLLRSQNPFIFPFRLFQFYSLYHLHSLPIYFFTFCFYPFPFRATFCTYLFTLKTPASSSFTNRKSNLAYRGPHSARIFQRLIFYTDLPRYKGNITFSWQESDLWISLYVPSNVRERNVLCFLIALNGKAKSLSKMNSTLKGESFNSFDLPFLNG